MPHHRLPNKPRSLHRQLSGRTSLTTASTITQSPLPSTLEHSLDKWLSQSSSNSSNNSVSSEKTSDPVFYGTGNGNHLTHSPTETAGLLTDSSNTASPPPQPRPSASVPVAMHSDQQTHSSAHSCPCCQLTNCQPWKKVYKVIRKLETETRLAAEIGQSLLQKNEAYLMESNHLREQVKQCEDRTLELEISLDDTECLAQKLKHEKDKWMWQYEKSEKILNESVVDLENTNLKCTALAHDLEQAKTEMEKLELFRYRSHQSNTHEDILQTKLEDTMQELVISKKAEITLESKYKKLLARYEALSSTYQDLCKKSPIKNAYSKHFKSLSVIPSTAADIEQASTDELATFIKDLLSMNDNLKSRLLNTSIQLDDTRNEINFLRNKHDSTTQDNEKLPEEQFTQPIGSKRHTAIAAADGKVPGVCQFSKRPNGLRRRHHSASSSTPKSNYLEESIKSAPSQTSTTKNASPIPQTTVSTPVVHHHYHYYLRQRQQNGSSDGSCSAENDTDFVSAYCNDRNCLDSASNEETPMPLTSDASPQCIDIDMINGNYPRPFPLETTAENGLSTPINNIEKIQQPQHHDKDTGIYPGHAFEKVTTSAIDYAELDNLTLTLSPSSSAPIPTTSKATTIKHHSPPEDSFMPQTSGCNVKDCPSIIKPTPYSSLLDQAKSILQRLRATDARILNRRLQRTFDIRELSNMSNAIIQNIVSEVDTIDARFFWLAPEENIGDDGHCNGSQDEGGRTKRHSPPSAASSSFLVNEFFPIVRLLQELLQEIGQLSITINHLQVAYVEKVEENEARVEREFMGKYQMRPSTSNRNDILNKNSSNIDMTHSLVPPTSISTSTTCTPSTIPLSEQNKVDPVHWLSTLFDNTRNLEKKSTAYHRPAIRSTPNNNKNTTTTTATLIETGDDDNRTKDCRHKVLEDHQIKSVIRKKPGQCQQQQHHQRHQLDRFAENQTYKQLWSTISSVMDEWNHITVKHSFSSSLDREWLLDLH